MSTHLELPRLGWDSVGILSVCNHLYKIYYAFTKESRCVIVVKKEKDAMCDKDEIYAYSNVSKKSVQGNQ